MTKYIASCSFGKDSLATILLCLIHGEPLDEAVYCEVMFDKDISGEIPEHRDFIYDTAIPFLQREGIKVEVLRSDKTYLDYFYGISSRGKSKGKVHGFPICGMCSICRDCKLPPIRAYQKALSPDTVQYIGIAKDEQERLLRLDGRRISLLDKYGVMEDEAKELCRKYGLLSPIYEFSKRNGCFFCPNAKAKELRHLYDHHRDLWERLLELHHVPNKCSEKFNRDYTFAEIDARFQQDDLQISIFDLI